MLDRALVFGLTDEIERRWRTTAMFLAPWPTLSPREVLLEGDVEPPVKAGFDGPMAWHSLGEGWRRQRARGDVEPALQTGSAGALDVRFDHDETAWLLVSKRPWPLSRVVAMSSSLLGALAK
jgi:hypothetical protein